MRMAVRLGVRTLAGTPVEPLTASFANAVAYVEAPPARRTIEVPHPADAASS